MFCKNCGSKLDNDAIFCTNCGKKLSDVFTAKYCVACGVKLDDDAVFCSNCGYKVHEEKVNNDITDEKTFSNESCIDEETQEKFENADENAADVDRGSNTNETINDTVSVDKQDIKDTFEEVKTIPVVPESEKVLETSSEESKKKHDKLVNKLLWLTLIIFFTVFVLYPYVAVNTKSPWVSNETFSFDVYKPYTFNHYNAEEDDDYEFDCYKLSSKVISEIKENPPRYIIYNQKKYEMDDYAVDYFDLDLETQDGFLNEYYGITNNIIRNYNAIIFWNDYDGKYHHFDSVMILDGAESFILYKYIDYSNFNY